MVVKGRPTQQAQREPQPCSCRCYDQFPYMGGPGPDSYVAGAAEPNLPGPRSVIPCAPRSPLTSADRGPPSGAVVTRSCPRPLGNTEGREEGEGGASPLRSPPQRSMSATRRGDVSRSPRRCVRVPGRGSGGRVRRAGSRSKAAAPLWLVGRAQNWVTEGPGVALCSGWCRAKTPAAK